MIPAKAGSTQQMVLRKYNIKNTVSKIIPTNGL